MVLDIYLYAKICLQLVRQRKTEVVACYALKVLISKPTYCRNSLIKISTMVSVALPTRRFLLSCDTGFLVHCEGLVHSRQRWQAHS